MNTSGFFSGGSQSSTVDGQKSCTRWDRIQNEIVYIFNWSTKCLSRWKPGKSWGRKVVDYSRLISLKVIQRFFLGSARESAGIKTPPNHRRCQGVWECINLVLLRTSNTLHLGHLTLFDPPWEMSFSFQPYMGYIGQNRVIFGEQARGACANGRISLCMVDFWEYISYSNWYELTSFY